MLLHPGQPIAPHDFWGAWSTEPAVLAGLGLTAAAYVAGVRRLWRAAGSGHGVSRRAIAAFAVGWLALVVALVSPIDALGTALFSGHMMQHLLLMQVAAPALVLGSPLVVWLWSLPAGARRRVGGWWRLSRLAAVAGVLTMPLVALVLQTVVLWFWHVPGPYEAALRDDAVHALEHATFLATAIAFWWTTIGRPARTHGRRGVAVLLLFGAAMQSGILGALLTFSTRPWYTGHEAAVGAWGLTPLDDQQLAGILMWAPAGLPYLVAAGWLVVAWLGGSGASSRSERASSRSPSTSWT